MELTLVPAYGRDYKSKDAVIKAWNEGKDFKIATAVSPDCGRYTSVRDLKSFPGTWCKIRYNKNADFILVNVKSGDIEGDQDTLEIPEIEYDDV